MLARARRGRAGIPPPADLVSVQRAGTRAGGLPGLVGEILASYTGDPLPSGSTSAVRAGGRRVLATADTDGIRWSVPAPDPMLRRDRVLTRRLLGIGLQLSPDRLRFGQAVLAGLAADALEAAQPEASRHNAEALAAACTAAGAPTSWEVRSRGDRSELGLRPTEDGAAPLVSQVLALLDAGLVHGRIGAVAPDPVLVGDVALWECVRRVAPGCRDFLVALLDAAGDPSPRAVAHVTDRGAAIGLPTSSMATNVGALLERIEPLTGPWSARIRPASTGTSTAGITGVDDPVGVLYGLADLLAVARSVTGRDPGSRSG